MGQKLTQNILDIFPALFVMAITGGWLIYFSKDRERSHAEVVVFSFLFLFSGFITQIIVENIDSINLFLERGKSLFSLPIISAISGTFVVNRLLKNIADKKEKREVAILLAEIIESQVKSLNTISFIIATPVTFPNQGKLDKDYIANIQANENLINIYKGNVFQNKLLDSAFEKVGIFDEKEIEIICYYVSTLNDTLLDLEKVLFFKNESSTFLVLRLRLSLNCTSLVGCLLVYYLRLIYTKKEYSTIKKKFADEFEQTLNCLLTIFEWTNTCYEYNPDGKLVTDVVERIKNIKYHLNNLNLDLYGITKKVIYVCRIKTNKMNKDLQPIIFSRCQYHIYPPDEFIYINRGYLDINTVKSKAKEKLKMLIENNINKYSGNESINQEQYIKSLNNLILDEFTVEVITPWEK